MRIFSSLAMFTGIIEDIGKVTDITLRSGNKILTIKTSLKDLKESDSIAIEGVCLTVIGIKDDTFKVEVTKETLKQTTLKFLKRGDFCNLERAIPAQGRLHGHFILGHIDEIGRIIKITRSGRNFIFEIRVSDKNLPLLVEKGSIAVSGISLTIQRSKGSIFSTVIIPFTYENTTLKYKRQGSEVNIEYDILCKYALKL